jgi:16S rRNA (guanine527-N7)-methyltransferase
LVDFHLADSLVALELEAVRHATFIADIGSGAGFPGVPLAVALPNAQVRLVESKGRSCQFLRKSIELLSLAYTEVVCVRVEGWQDGKETCDLVCARALASLAVILEYAAPLLVLGGSVLAWKGVRNGDEEHAAAIAAQVLELKLQEVRHVQPFVGAKHRHLHHYVKEKATPARFPRRVGVARKQPLGD